MQNLKPSSYRLPIQQKLFKLLVIIGITSTLFLLFFYYSFSLGLKNEKKTQSKYKVESAIGIIQFFQHKTTTGELTLLEAKSLAKETLSAASYGEDGYLWVNTTDGKILVQPYQTDLVGKNMLNWKDKNGVYPFQEFDRVAHEGGGWVLYSWPKKINKTEYPKLSYVTFYEPWDWLIGTGVYLEQMENDIFWAVMKASGIVLIAFLIFSIATVSLAKHFIDNLSELAIKDGLTELFSKRFLKEITPSLLSNNNINNYLLATVFIDIDHFKHINDSYGHACGDEVLIESAKIIKYTAKTSDYCFRYGGEEFLVIGFFDKKESILAMAESMREKIEAYQFSNNTDRFQVTASIGIAIFDNEKERFEDTLARADMKLYESKENGRNQVRIE